MNAFMNGIQLIGEGLLTILTLGQNKRNQEALPYNKSAKFCNYMTDSSDYNAIQSDWDAIGSDWGRGGDDFPQVK